FAPVRAPRRPWSAPVEVRLRPLLSREPRPRPGTQQQPRRPAPLLDAIRSDEWHRERRRPDYGRAGIDLRGQIGARPGPCPANGLAFPPPCRVPWLRDSSRNGFILLHVSRRQPAPVRPAPS